jgi:predicted transcriptional regulator
MCMAKAAKSQILQVAVDKATERELLELARSADLPLSAIIRQAIVSYLLFQKQSKEVSA